MADGGNWWARYSSASMNEWDFPVDSRKLLKKLLKDDYWKLSKRISRRSRKEMIRRTTPNFVWMPREFHPAAKKDFGFLELGPNFNEDRRESLRYLRFVDDLDLTTLEGREVYLLYSSDFVCVARGEMFHFLLNEMDYLRLNGVKQLAYLGLYYSLHEGASLNDPNPCDILNHSRFTHSTLAAALIEDRMSRSRYTKEEIRHATLAAFLHDYATPGLGDTMKTLDRSGLDEEAHFLDSIPPEKRELIQNQLRIDLSAVEGIVTGRINSPASALLHSDGIDIDKISYVALDCFKFLQMCKNNQESPEWFTYLSRENDGLIHGKTFMEWKSKKVKCGLRKQFRSWEPPALKQQLEEILRQDPDLFDLHKDIEIHQENGTGRFKTVFSDPRKALAFIRLRANLCAGLYCSDESRAKESGYFFHLFSRLYGRGLLKAEHLRRMTDREASFTLMATLAELEGIPVGYGIKRNGDIRAYLSYTDEAYVVNYGEDCKLMDYFIPLTVGSKPYLIRKFSSYQELYRETPPSILNRYGTMIRRLKGFKTGEETLVKTRDGIVPLRDTLKPKQIQELRQLRDRTSGVYLFYPNPEYKEIFGRIKQLHEYARAHPRGEEYPLGEEFQYAKKMRSGSL